jgi:hypothetical protein
MGWNDHDDRLMSMSDMFQDYGIPYPECYEMALEIRTDEIVSGEIISESSLMAMAFDASEEYQS